MHAYTRRTPHRVLVLLAALVLAALLGGSAFTASNTMPAPDTVGYGETTVSGATVSSLTYNFNNAGNNVNSVTLVLAGDTRGSAVSIGFNGGATTSCGAGTRPLLGIGGNITTYECDNGGANFTRPTSGLVSTAVVVN